MANIHNAIMHASAAHVRQHPWPVLWLVLAITAAAAGLTAVLILNNAAHQDYQQQSSLFPIGSNFEIAGIVSNVEPLAIDQHKAFYSQIRAAGLTEIVAFQRQDMQIQINGITRDVSLVAVDAAALASFIGNAEPDPLGLVNAVAVSQDIAGYLTPDATVELAINSQVLQLPWVTLPAAQNSQATVLLDLHSLAQLNVVLAPSYAVLSTDTEQDIAALIDEQILRYTPNADVDNPIAITRSFHMSLLAMSLVMFLVCFFIVINALSLFIAGRARMLTIIRQLGIGHRIIIRLLQLELSCYAIAGALLGIFLGQLTAYLLAPSVATTLNNLFDVPVSLGKLFHLPIYAPIIATCIVATLASATAPIKRLSRQLKHISPTATVDNGTGKAKLLSVILAAITLCGMLFAAQLFTVFGTIATLLLCGVASLFWLYPVLIRLLVRISKNCGPLVHWTFSHANVIATHSRLACAAFFIALATHIGMTTMVDSFRTATEHWLQDRLIAPHYFYGDTETLLNLKQRLTHAGFRGQERYQMELNWQHKEVNFRIPTYSYPATNDYLQGLQVEHILPDGIREFRNHQGLFINQQLAFRQGLQLGDTLAVEVTDESVDLTIVGIHYDFGNPDTQILLPLDFLQHTAWTPEQLTSQAVRVMAIHSRDTIAIERFLNELGLSAERLYSRERLLSVSLAAFDQTFVITDALNLVTLLVAVFSLITSILLITNQTQYVSGVLRSIGVTRKQLVASLLGQYLTIALITALCALPFGIALAYVLVQKVNVVAFQWLFPLTIDGLAILVAMGSSLAIICVLSSAPILLSQSRSLREQMQCRE